MYILSLMHVYTQEVDKVSQTNDDDRRIQSIDLQKQMHMYDKGVSMLKTRI